MLTGRQHSPPMRVASYARYSSDNQREASLEDQLRNCRQYAERMGWPAPIEYRDAALSGTRSDRPGYRRLLGDAERFDVILVDDLSRLARDSVEITTTTRRLTFAGVRLIGVSDGTDTGRKGHTAEVGLRGIMSELYLTDLADKTHRGLMGRALDGASAGGLPYGYRAVAAGEREIDAIQAAVVRRIYADYIAGASAREIASSLNREGVPSPRGSTWAVSAIQGDYKRGIGILANPIYMGRQIWNRSMWVRHPVTRRRVRRERPETEWVVTERPDLAIITTELWEAAKAAKDRRSRATTGKRGRPARHLLTGLLRCCDCGGPIVVVDGTYYGCSVAKDRGTCAGGVRVNRRHAEAAMLAGVREALLSDQAMRAWQAAVSRQLVAQQGQRDEAKRRLSQARRERENVMAAIRAGIVLASTKSELERLERLCEQLEAEASETTRVMPDVRSRLKRIADTLGSRSAASPAVREALRAVIGQAVLEKKNGVPVARITPSELLQINMVAGVGFEPTTFGL